MITETLGPSFKFPSLWLVDVLQYRPLIGCKKNAQELNCKRRQSRKGAIKNFEFFFHQRGKQKIVKSISACTENINLILIQKKLLIS
jgi:hypothetical protein